MKKILWIGDGVTPTGFSTVNHNVISGLPQEEYEVHHIAINYFGDPHPYKHNIYPATSPYSLQMGDVYGFTRLKELFPKINPDLVFILNDIWVTQQYLEILKKEVKPETMPKIVVYFPVDGAGYFSGWFKDFDIVSKVVVYTEFGKNVVLRAAPHLEEKIEVIPHGNDTSVFYKKDKTKLRKRVYAKLPELWSDEAFIVLNANRNQPRKMLDLSLRGFALFAAKKPDNVKYYHHAGLRDAGWDIVRLIKQIDNEFLAHGILEPGDTLLENRLMVTNTETGVQRVSLEELNEIYNVTDIGINTSLGEGWGLTATEHAATGAPQIVPNHTACAELFYDCGLLTDTVLTVSDTQTLLYRSYIDVNHLASQLEQLYKDKELRTKLANAGYEKFTSDKYLWKNISMVWKSLFDKILGEKENV